MNSDSDSKNPAEELRRLLPEALAQDAEVAAGLKKVEEIAARQQLMARRHAFERAFLERAPREGLLHPGDALKLAEAGDPPETADEAGLERAVSGLYASLRRDRPWLFGAARGTPANEKLAPDDPPEIQRMREKLGKGALTRNLQLFRQAQGPRRKR